jgi:hypothetical protein
MHRSGGFSLHPRFTLTYNLGRAAIQSAVAVGPTHGVPSMNQELTDLIQKKTGGAQVAGGGVDWDQRRNTYLDAVRQLYDQVEAFLAEPIKQGVIRPQRRAKQLVESYLGTYSVDDLILLIGDEQVRFSPAGRNVAGATGRVDVVGEGGEATLLAQPGPRWSFVQTRQPTLQAVPFDEHALAEVLGQVMRA